MGGLRSFAFVVLLSTITVASCSKCDDRGGHTTEPPPLPALSASSANATLPVASFGDAVVAVPAGATRAMPVLVAVLGIGDSAEEQCATWREIVGTRAFVLCPRGAKNMVPDEVPDAGSSEEASEQQEEDEKPRARSAGDAGGYHQVGFFPVDQTTLTKELNAGLTALKARYGAHVAAEPILYAGFSRGAFLGASIGAKEPKRFDRLILIEGGQSAWRAEQAAAFAKGGGKRVLFVCGQPKCVEDSEAAAATLKAQKVDARVVHAVGAGHAYRKQVKDELRRSFDWVIEGDPRWPR